MLSDVLDGMVRSADEWTFVTSSMPLTVLHELQQYVSGLKADHRLQCTRSCCSALHKPCHLLH